LKPKEIISFKASVAIPLFQKSGCNLNQISAFLYLARPKFREINPAN